MNISCGGIVDATQTPYNVNGTGVDSTAGFQQLVNDVIAKGAGSGVTIQLPPGTIRVSAPIDYGNFGMVTLWGTDSTLITGNVPGPLLVRNQSGVAGSGCADLADLSFSNAHPAGSCVELNVITHGRFRKCNFKGWHQLVIGRVGNGNNNYGSLYDCFFDGSAHLPGAVGFAINNGDVNLYNVSATGLDTALQLSGFARIFGGAIEMCGTGIVAGMKPDGSAGPCSLLVEGVRWEACINALHFLKSAYYSSVNNFRVGGDAQGGTVFPDYGIKVDAGAGPIAFSSGLVDGSYAKAAISLGLPSRGSFLGVDAVNQGHAAGGSVVAWDTPGTVPEWTFSGCNHV